ncbi:MAG: LysR family transcriptional regulator [Caulobacteraceae bacterium]
MDLQDLRLFVMVAGAGTLSGAAEELQLPKSSASRSIAGLEQELGIALLYRTNRRIGLTEAGSRFLDYAIGILEQWTEAGAALDQMRDAPVGILRVAAPVNPGQFLIAPLVRPFLERYPSIRLSLTLTSEKVDPIVSGMDIAIRAGALEDSRLIAKRLGVTRLGLFASPAYLAGAGQIDRPQDLLRLTLLDIAGSDGHWSLSNADEALQLRVEPRIWVNDTTTIKTILTSGFGVGWLPTYMVRDEIAEGLLVRVLPNWTRGDREFHALFVHHRIISPKVRAFVDFISDSFVVRD